MTSTRFKRHDLHSDISIPDRIQQGVTNEADQQRKNNQLQIDLAIIKFVIFALLLDSIIFLVF